MKALSALLIVLSAAGVSISGSYYEGQIDDGYSYHSGYWWYGDNAYSRDLHVKDGYYTGPVYYPGYSYYVYHFDHAKSQEVPLALPGPSSAPGAVPSAPGSPPPAPSAAAGDWRTQVLQMATAQQELTKNLQADAVQQMYFLETLKLLGLPNSMKPANNYAPNATYGAAPTATGSFQLSSAGENGSTIYGYGLSYNSFASLYGDNNLNVLYQQANRLAENAQRLDGEAVAQFQGLVGTEGANRNRVAEIIAKRELIATTLQALNTPQVSVQSSGTVTLPPQPAVPLTLAPNTPPPANNNLALPDPATVQRNWLQSAARCKSCHSGTRLEGGYDITRFPSQDLETKKKVLGRLTTSDLAKRMPRKEDGSAAEPLPPQELAFWLTVKE